METSKLVQLVEAVQQAKPAAATNLYNTFQKDLYFHIYKTVDDASLAEDLLQETFMEIFLKIKDLKEPAAFVTWSRQIAYSKGTAYFRKTHEILVDEDEDGHSIFDTLEEDREEFIPGEALDKEDLKQAIQQIISQLPGEQRSAILLHYFDELSIKDIAEIQGVTEGTVKSRLNYGRKAIKQGVETYEKKNGIKLHCLGVVPLLLWLLKAQASASSAASTAATAANVVAGIETVSDVASGIGAATDVAAPAVKKGIKAAGKFVTRKVAAGAIAAAVAVGGVATAVVLSQPEPEKSMVWTGTGKLGAKECYSFQLTVEEMDEEQIEGHLIVSRYRDTVHATDFTGTGKEGKDGQTIYEIVYEHPLELDIGPDHEDTTLKFDEEKDQFSINSVYDVRMDRISGEAPEVLVENGSWYGIGTDSHYVRGEDRRNHLFEMDVHHMTEQEISGTLKVSKNGVEEHSTEFSGYGHIHNGTTIHYRMYFATTRPYYLEWWEIYYDTETGIFETPLIQTYEVRMEKGTYTAP